MLVQAVLDGFQALGFSRCAVSAAARNPVDTKELLIKTPSNPIGLSNDPLQAPSKMAPFRRPKQNPIALGGLQVCKKAILGTAEKMQPLAPHRWRPEQAEATKVPAWRGA